jgi:DNA mismatch repair protein MutS2
MFTTPKEISLRGLTWEQAQPILEKYLDDASLGGVSPVCIIHGRGTGSLRAAVHHLLSSHPLVKSFRLADNREGGQGVTIVEL